MRREPRFSFALTVMLTGVSLAAFQKECSFRGGARMIIAAKDLLLQMWARGVSATTGVTVGLREFEERYGEDPEARRIANHMVGSMERWLGILGCEGFSPDADPNPTLIPGELETRMASALAVGNRLIESLDVQALNTLVEFIGRDGSSKKATVISILVHSIMHSQGHRAQIVKMLNGRSDPDHKLNTDYIRLAILQDEADLP